jgi:hypothetical protein
MGLLSNEGTFREREVGGRKQKYMQKSMKVLNIWLLEHITHTTKK